MKTLIIGAIAAVVGIILLSVWFNLFLQVLGGVFPIMFLLGGGLAIYLGFDELKDTWKRGDTKVDAPAQSDEVDQYKQEINDLKKELETLKKA